MDNYTIEKIKEISKNATMTPPDRVWNRLEYKLDRMEIEHNKNRNNKLVFTSSVAAVLIVLFGSIFLMNNEITEPDIYQKSNMIIINLESKTNTHQAYDIHHLKEYYSKYQIKEEALKPKKLLVNHNPNG